MYRGAARDCVPEDGPDRQPAIYLNRRLIMPVNGKLTYDEMKAILERGESVLVDGKAIRHVSQLPSPIKIAGNDPEAIERERQRIASERKRLEAEEAELLNVVGDGNTTSTATPPKQPPVIHGKSVTEWAKMSNKDIIALPDIGQARLKEIRDAVEKWEREQPQD